MVSEIYCKLKTLEGNDLHLKRFVDEIYSELHPKSFSYNPFGEALASVLIEQKLCRKKAADKLPAWVEGKCLFAPVALEQATSESVARAKARLFSGNNLLSITGGLGCDEFMLANSFEKVTGMDTDECLNTLVRLNLKLLGCKNAERLDCAAEDYLLNTTECFDVIYSDPDRRPGRNRVAADARLYSPNIFELYKLHKSKANCWLTKLSPMTDLTWIRRQFNEPCRIFVFYHKNEIKELLVETGVGVVDENLVVDVKQGGTCAVIGEKDLVPEKKTAVEVFCELSAACIKADFGPQMAENCNWKNENGGTYFTGNCTVNSALGRCFELKGRLKGSIAEMGTQLKKLGINRANISARNFVADADEIRKKLGFLDGGEDYLFFTGRDKEKKCFVCRKLE